MSVSHRYQTFDQPSAQIDPASPQSQEELEDVKLTAFETGYQAGWDDALRSQQDLDQKLTSEFVQNLEDMSFTYHEAYAKLSDGMKPLLSKIVSKILPQIAEKSMGVQILDQLNGLIDAEGRTKIEIAVSPEKHAAINQLLAEKVSVPFKVTAEQALTGGQVYLRAGQTEREINLDLVLDGINTAVDAFFHTTQQETDHE